MTFFSDVFSNHRIISVEEIDFESDTNHIITTMRMKHKDFIITMNFPFEDKIRLVIGHFLI